MIIEVWSDFVCPFCYIGKRRLEQALDVFPHKDKVEIQFKAFELDPNASRETTLTIHEAIAKKYGTSVEQAKKMNDNIVQQAKEVGLQFNYDKVKFTNTLDAHRLAKFAETKGNAAEMTERLLHAYFHDNIVLSDKKSLLQLAAELGLDQTETDLILKGDQFESEVRFDEQEAREIGVQGVPFFVINRKYAISGAQPKEVFLNALEQVWEEENQKQTLQPLGKTDQTAAVCNETGCDIDNK